MHYDEAYHHGRDTKIQCTCLGFRGAGEKTGLSWMLERSEKAACAKFLDFPVIGALPINLEFKNSIKCKLKSLGYRNIQERLEFSASIKMRMNRKESLG